MGFLTAEDESELLPILCGYFNKIMQSMLAKQKKKTLQYLLLKQEGAIFDGLLKHMQHHSLSIFLIELMEIQVN